MQRRNRINSVIQQAESEANAEESKMLENFLRMVTHKQVKVMKKMWIDSHDKLIEHLASLNLTEQSQSLSKIFSSYCIGSSCKFLESVIQDIRCAKTIDANAILLGEILNILRKIWMAPSYRAGDDHKKKLIDLAEEAIKGVNNANKKNNNASKDSGMSPSTEMEGKQKEMNEKVERLLSLISSRKRKEIKKIWTDDEALRQYFSGWEIFLNENQSLSYKLSLSACLKHFNQASSTGDFTYIMYHMYEMNPELRDYLVGKPVFLDANKSNKSYQCGEAEQFGSLMCIIKGRAYEIVKEIWQGEYAGRMAAYIESQPAPAQHFMLNQMLDSHFVASVAFRVLLAGIESLSLVEKILDYVKNKEGKIYKKVAGIIEKRVDQLKGPQLVISEALEPKTNKRKFSLLDEIIEEILTPSSSTSSWQSQPSRAETHDASQVSTSSGAGHLTFWSPADEDNRMNELDPNKLDPNEEDPDFDWTAYLADDTRFGV